MIIRWLAVGTISLGISLAAISPAIASSLTQLFPALSGIDLTSQQQQQLVALSQQRIPQIEAILTPGQRLRFKAAIAGGKSVRTALLSLDISLQQRQKILRIMQSTKQQMNGILTLSQQRQLEQNANSLR
jgi:hypothetical protein